MAAKSKIKIGIIGVGNVAAGLIEGIEYYRSNPQDKSGLMHEDICGYKIWDVDVGCAFDISSWKVDKRFDVALYSKPNKVNWIKVHKKYIYVKQAPQLDSIGKYVKHVIKPVRERPIDTLENEIILEIKKSRTTVLVNLLPVGSQKATEFWARVALKTKCAFVNAIPVFIASDKKWAKKFKEFNVPIIGDDMKGIIGATIVHRVLARLAQIRGTNLVDTYQLNVGGNTDFKNMLERERLVSKKISKTNSVQSQIRYPLKQSNIHIGPSDFIEFLGNTKIAYIRINGSMWARQSYHIDLKLEVDDKANAGGVLIDAIRLVRVAQDRAIGGVLIDPSAYLMKHPPIQFNDDKAFENLEKFINKE